MATHRYLEPAIRDDLTDTMVFIAGPRQVGKSTVARQILAASGGGVCLDWDSRADRLDIRASRWPSGPSLVVLDELHKWRGWRGWLGREYDTHRPATRFLVTGSARLTTSGGDALEGRYHHYHLHQFSLREAHAEKTSTPVVPGKALPIRAGSTDTLASLMEFGGFPEPFLAQSARTHRRWQRERLERFFREDVRDLEAVRDLSSLQLLADLLPERVASPLSLNALREGVGASHRALTHWIDIFERLYYVARVRPFETSTVRGLRKMPKAYLWDWSQVPAKGPRFENLVALHLLKLCHFLKEHDGLNVELFYLRDRTGREVDFLLTAGGQPWLAVEAKVGDSALDPALRYFRERLKIPFAYQVVLDGTRDFVEDGVRCVPAADFLAALV